MTIHLDIDISIVVSFISTLYVVIKMTAKKISSRTTNTRAEIYIVITY